jgi:drug/metabolite transporter (DMT)-like permease
MAEFWAYLFYFVVASASPIQRRWLAINRPKHKGELLFATRVMGIVALMSLAILLFSRPSFNGNPWFIIFLTVLCAIGGGGFFAGQYTAQRHVQAGTTSVISNIFTPVTIILATIFLQERLELHQLFGTTLLLFSAFLVTKNHRGGKFHVDKYIWLMLVSGIGLGIAMTAQRELIKVTGFTAASLLSLISPVIFLGLLAWLTKSKTTYKAKDTWITGGLYFTQLLSWVVLVAVVANLSVVSSITTFKVVIIFGIGAIYLHEHDDLLRKIIGAGIAVIGLWLMT